MRKLLQEIHDTDILKVFHSEKTPLHAIVRLSEYSLTWLITQLFNNQQGKPLRLLPFQSVMLWMLWNKKFPMILAARGGSKTFMLGLYALVRAILCPGSEIIIVGSGLRQSMKVFGYIVKLYNQSPLIQEAIKKYDRKVGIVHSGPRIVMTGPYMKVGLSTITALPIGDGEKIRGQRATQILVDEFACLAANTLVETNYGLLRIKDCKKYLNDIALFTGEDNIMECPSKFIETPKTDVYKVITKYGYEFQCSSIHKVMTNNGWKLAKDLTIEDHLLFENNYEFPNEYIYYDDTIVDEKLAYLMGILVSEGNINNQYTIGVTNTDKKLIDEIYDIFDSYGLKPNIYCRNSYQDRRGWKCKKNYYLYVTNKQFRSFLESIGLEKAVAIDKKIPWSILQSSKSVVISFLKGLFVGDGSVFHWKDRDKSNLLGVAYYSVSEQLVSEVHVLLSKLNFLSYKNYRESSLSDNKQWFVRLNGLYAHDLANLLNITKWTSIIEAARLPHNPKNKGIIYIKRFDKWQAKYYTCGKTQYIGQYNTKEQAIAALSDFDKKMYLMVRSVEKMPEQQVLYDFYLPDTHSFYGNGFKQHNSINESIFETVIRPFAAVHVNPEERVHVQNFCNKLKKMGAHDDVVDKILAMQGYGNQIVITGTASYEFNHFFKHYQSYRMIVESCGNPDMIKKAMEIRSRISGDHFSRMSKDEISTLAKGWRNYAVLKMPYTEIPVGFLDAEVVANDKATFTAVRFGLEYGCEFAKDSDGYIKRSVIEDATPKEEGAFSIELYGEPGREYVLGLDPAKFNDNFGLVVLKLTPTGMQPVYADAWMGKDTPESVRKIRDILRRFNIVRIAIDQGGGGEAVAETLRDPKHCEPGELPIYPLREQIQDKKMLGAEALFMLDVVKWSSSWIALNAPALQGDIHHHRLLFPIHPVVEDLYRQYERRALCEKRKINDDEKRVINQMTFGKETDDFEIIEAGAWDNLQAMIDETCAIERVVTQGGVEKFELPSVGDQPDGMDIRRRDRFSALVLAAYAGRIYRDINRNKRPVIPGGSPEALLRLGRGRRPRINKKGNVMY